MNLDRLQLFVRESNHIEGIPSDAEREEKELTNYIRLLELPHVRISDLVHFVVVVQPNAMLRNSPDVPGVQVGAHIAPTSGRGIVRRLERVLQDAHEDLVTPHSVHCAYEMLHPFTDGNGRSGRALWLWHMRRLGEGKMALRRGFLHSWYYQTLEAVSP